MQKYNQEIAQAWERFVSTGILDSDKVPKAIEESWQRCRAAKVDPYTGGISPFIEGAELEELRVKKRNLISITRPFMENLYDFVTGSGFMVLLSDEYGYILEALGDKDIHSKSMEINLVPGGIWAEREVGTNGIGTALVMRKPVQVSGPEHYCRKIHPWTCSAAPIFDDSDEIIGALQMSGPSEASHKHTLGMVVAAVKAIEEQLRVQYTNRELILVNSRLNNIFHTMSDGVIIINPNGTIDQVNPAAERNLGKSKNMLQGIHIEEVFQNLPKIKELLHSGKSFSNIEVLAELGKVDMHCLISGEPIRNHQGVHTGGVIIINPINKIKKLVNRFSGAEARFEFSNIIGSGPELQKAIRIASLAAESDSNVLLEGESGTGKEVFAQAIHNRSQRRNGPFVALNCAAIPRELMGSELFGYVEGAFTGAYRGGRPGKFELASGGTLFLDEIGDMTQGKQGSLLRAIQEKQIVRIGGNKVIPVDVRIICATNKDLRAAVDKGNFREDLYYRLNVITIKLPPLRNRREDIPQLFEYFVEEISRRLNIHIDKYEPDIIPVLKQYSWPGNTRELQNVVERMLCVTQGNKLSVRDLPEEMLPGPAEKPADEEQYSDDNTISVGRQRELRRQQLAASEYQEIMDLLERYGGNISTVARQMGVSRNTIYRRLRQYNIQL
ncbi:MAG: sigma-54-dependent Fis family transcriptional regulator [Syntrophomonadaceae bacterium]